MNVLIKLEYIGWEGNTESKGYFPINKRKFEEKEDLAIAEVAYQWVKDIRRAENISKIVKITYSGDRDITEIVPYENIDWVEYDNGDNNP